MRPERSFVDLNDGLRLTIFTLAILLGVLVLKPSAPAHALTIPCLGTSPDIPGCPITVPTLPCLPIGNFTLPLVGSVKFPPGCSGADVPCVTAGVPPGCSGTPLASIPCIYTGFPAGCTGSPILSSYPCVSAGYPPGCTAIPLPKIPCIAPGTPPGCTGTGIVTSIPCISQSPPMPPGCTPIPLSFFPCVSPGTPPGCTSIPLPCISPGTPPGCITVAFPCITPGNPPGCTWVPIPCAAPGIPPGCTDVPKPCIGTDSAGNNVPPGCYGTPPATSCDPETLDAMEARGQMEAQREVMQSENMILRPDSVLEYSCLDALQYNVTAGVNFSETGWIGSFGKLGIFALDNALIDTSIKVLFQPSLVPPKGYLMENFLQPLFGSRMGLTDYYLPSIPYIFYNMQPYPCDYMQQIWDTAKCMDFFDEEDHDAFYDFDWYETNDPRTYLMQLGWNQANTCTVVNLAKGKLPKITPIQVGIASNWETGSHVIAPENPWPSDTTPYVDAPVNAGFMNLILPVGTVVTTGNVTCAPPIKTGVCVKRDDNGNVGPYMDAVCPNPGCHYNVPAGGGTGCADTFNCVP